MREQPQTPPTSPHCQARAQASRQSSRQAQAGKPSEMLTEGTEERTWPPGPQHILVSVVTGQREAVAIHRCGLFHIYNVRSFRFLKRFLQTPVSIHGLPHLRSN